MSLSRKVHFGVLIDILANEKFANLREKKVLFSYFYLFLICIFFLLFSIFLEGAKHNV